MRRRLLSPVAVASAAYVTYFVSVGAFLPYVPVYARSLGFDLSVVGLLTALAAATQLVAGPSWGIIADRFAGSRLVVPTAALLGACAALLLAAVRGPAAVAVGIVAVSLSAGGVLPILDARALEAVRDDRDRYGRLRAWGSISFVGGVSVVGLLIDRIGPSGLFVVYVPALLATALVTLAMPGSHPVAATRFGPLRAVLGSPPLRRFLLAALAAWTALTLTTAFFSIYLIDLGAPGLLVGAAWGLGALVEVPVMWAFPALAARVGTERLLVLGAAFFAARTLALAIFVEPLVLVGISTISGVGFALFLVGGVTYVSRHAPAGAAATAQGVFTGGSFGLALILGSVIGGISADAVGLRSMFAFAAVFGVFAVTGVAIAVRAARISAASEAERSLQAARATTLEQ